MKLKFHHRIINPNYKPSPCPCCGKENPNLVMIKHELWKQTGLKGWVCFSCIEKRLGRKLTLEDLQPCGATNSMIMGALLYARANEKPEFDETFVEEF